MLQQLRHKHEKSVRAADLAATVAEPASAAPLAQQETREAEEIDEWLDYVARPRPLPWLPITVAAAVGLYPVYNALLLVLHLLPGDYQIGPLSAIQMMASGLVFPTIWIWHILKVERLKTETQDDAMLGSPDARWIGPLIDTLDAPNRRVRAAAARQLTRVLTRIQPEDAGLISPAHAQILYDVLRRNAASNSELVAAILKAIGRLGMTEAAWLVEQVTVDRRRSPRRRYVRQTAFDGLAKLDKRLAAEVRDSGLLSGSAVAPQCPAVEVSAESAAADAAYEPIRQLIADLEEQRRKSGQPGMRKGFLAASWLTIVPYTGYQLAHSFMDGNWAALLVWSAGFGIATQLHRYVLSNKRSQAAQALAAYDDVRAVGLLADMLEWPDAEMKAVAKTALTRLLPRLRASDAGLLNSQQRAALYRVLRMHNAVNEQRLMLAILGALQQVGDEQAVPYVMHLANSAVWFRAQQRIKQAAHECLPFLNERARQQRASETLLRASGIESNAPDLLLRPAAETASSDPQQLLRVGLKNDTVG